MTLAKLGYDSVTQRTLYALDMPAFPADLPELDLGSEHFVCMLAADFRRLSNEDVMRLAEHLADAGASYYVCWGPECERAHDLIDEVLDERDPECTVDSVVMTTWHDDESLDDALFFFLVTAWPADDYYDSTRAGLAITLHAPEAVERVREALAHPNEFVRSLPEDR